MKEVQSDKEAFDAELAATGSAKNERGSNAFARTSPKTVLPVE